MNRIAIKNDFVFSFLPYLIYFLGSFICFGFFVDYVLFYQEKSSLFITSFDFFVENLHQPGGLLIYLGKFFSTFFYNPIVGAALVSVILTLIVLLISKIFGILTGKRSVIVPLLIGVALFFLQTDYRFLLFYNLGLLLQLVVYFLTIRYLKFLKGWVPVLLNPLWYFATGGFAWIFALMLTFYFASMNRGKERIKIVLLWSLCILTIWISIEYIFFQSVKTLLLFPFLELKVGSLQILFLVVACMISLLPIIVRIKFNLLAKLKLAESTGGLITAAFVAMFLIIIGVVQFDRKDKQYFHIEKLFYQNKFDEIIAYNTANPPSNSLTIFLNNIALCETDQLNDLLFHFRQSPDGSTLFLKWEMVGEILKRGAYFYYTVGMINEAQRWAFENMVMKGLSPEGLKMLIRTELINGNYKVASRYIAILKNTIFYKGEAVAFEKLLFNETAINANRELGEKRRTRLKADFFTITDDPYINIERILATDSLNKKAFEYKLAFLLLKKDYRNVAALFPKLEVMGFKKIPVHIEEAAIAYASLNSKPLPELKSISIDPQTLQRLTQFLQTFQAKGNNLKTAEPALRKQFGDTFWYYSFYL